VPQHDHHDPHTPLTVRRADEHDAVDILRVAALDSAGPIVGEALVAELAGRMVAAVALADGRVIADPFVRTVEVVALLELRAAQLRAPLAARKGRAAAVVRAATAR
jgi:hypothetical protein